MSSRGPLRRSLGVLAAILLSLALAALALSRSELGPQAIGALWSQARPGPILAALAVMTSGMFSLGLRWRSLIPGGEQLPLLPMSALTTTGLLLNVALPGPAGELAVALMVHRRYGLPATSALAGGITARFLGVATAGLIATLAQASGRMPVPPEYQGMMSLASGVIGMAALLLAAIALRPALLSSLSQHTLGRLTGTSRLGETCERGNQALHRMAAAMHAVTELPWQRWVTAVLASFGSHGCVILGIAIGAWGMGVSVSLPGLAYTYGAATAGIVALFAVPGAQLGWDAMFAAFLHLAAGVPPAQAVAVTALVRLQQTLLLVLGAGTLMLSGTSKTTGNPG